MRAVHAVRSVRMRCDFSLLLVNAMISLPTSVARAIAVQCARTPLVF